MKRMFILPLAALIISCGGKQKSEDEKPNVEEFSEIAEILKTDIQQPKSVSKTDGVYIGFIVDEKGVASKDTTIIELKGKSYVREKRSSDKSARKDLRFEGACMWNREGTTVALVGTDMPYKFALEGGALLQLDADDNRLPEENALKYKLTKQ